MITNEFFQGYHQALNTIEENVDNLLDKYKVTDQDDLEYAVLILTQVKSHIRQVRSSYKELQRQLANEQKKERT